MGWVAMVGEPIGYEGWFVVGASEPQVHTRHADRTEGKCLLCDAISTRGCQYEPALYSEATGHSAVAVAFWGAEDRNFNPGPGVSKGRAVAVALRGAEDRNAIDLDAERREVQ
ncbi:hypothetical protein [Streptomyces sp. NPDC056045]|uniref:hypothetical protein n=1 Tax=Streptomyces sp. NPDC056045 TaxID=3345691 RepID=UPI0035DADECC